MKELGDQPFIALVNNAGIAKNYPVELTHAQTSKLITSV
jgi:hypothetical protein